MRRLVLGRCSCCFLLALSVAGCASNEVLFSNAGYAIEPSGKKIASWKALNEQNMYVQRFDYSCGAAALATLMKYYFDDEVSEQSLLADVEEILSTEQYEVVEKEGLSLLELEQISESRGYQAVSVRLKSSALAQLKGPILVYVEPDGYRHFAILRGVVGDRVFLADPSRGNIRLSVDEFEEEWKGQALILGKEGFGLPDMHGLHINLEPGFRHELVAARHDARPDIRILVPE